MADSKFIYYVLLSGVMLGSLCGIFIIESGDTDLDGLESADYSIDENGKLTFNQSITTIPENAFKDNTNITSVDLSSCTGEIKIGNNAFSGDTSISSITWPTSCSSISIGEAAFKSCKGLTSLNFSGSSSIDIGKNAFNSCDNVSSITFSQSNVTLGESAFQQSAVSTSLTSLNFSSCTGTIEIGKKAFINDSKISGIVWPNSCVKLTIGESALQNVKIGFDLPEGTTELGKKALYAATSIHIPSTLVKINQLTSNSNASFKLNSINSLSVAEGNNKYFMIDGVFYEKNDAKLTLLKAWDANESITIPNDATITGTPFKGFIKLRTIVIGSGISQLPDLSFYNCSSLSSVSFADSSQLTSIGASAFKGTPLTQIEIPDSVTAIGNGAFMGCESLTSFSVKTESSSLSTIGDNVFKGCTALKNVTVPKGITSLSVNAFEGCWSLHDLNLIGQGSLIYSKGMLISETETGGKLLLVLPSYDSIVLGSNVSSIQRGAFSSAVLRTIDVSETNAAYRAVQSKTALVDANNQLIYVVNNAYSLNISASDNVVGISDNNVWSSTARDVMKNASNLKRIVWQSENDITVPILEGGQFEEFIIETSGNASLGQISSKNLKMMDITCSSLTTTNRTLLNGSVGSIDLSVSITGEDGTWTMAGPAIGPCVSELALSGYNNLDGLFDIGTYCDLQITVDGNEITATEALLGITLQNGTAGYDPKIVKIVNTTNPYILMDLENDSGVSNSNLCLSIDGNDTWSYDSVNRLIKIDLSAVEGPRVISFTVSVKDDIEKITITRIISGTESSFTVDKGNRLTTEMLNKDVEIQGYEIKGWYLDTKMEGMYVDSYISDPLTLYARLSKNDGHSITIEPENSVDARFSDGTRYYSGDRVPDNTVIVLSPATSEYEVISWIVDDITSTTKTISVTVSKDTTVVFNSHYVSLSSILTGITSANAPVDDISLIWERPFEVRTEMNIWTGYPSIPLIVDDYIYVRASEYLYKISTEDGSIVKRTDRVEGSTVVNYYHYLGYGNGYIIDYKTSQVYDLDLIPYKTLSKAYTSVYYYEGNYYGLSDNKLWKMDSDFELVTTGSWSSGVTTTWHGIYGTTSSPVFIGDYIYFIEITGTNGESRAISGINLNTGTYQTRIIADLEGMLIDDGWLSSYSYEGDSYLFMTAYASGLFENVTSNAKIGVVCVGSDGSFKNIGTNESISITLQNGGAASAFIVNNGRGYINVTSNNGGNLYVIDVDSVLAGKQSLSYSEPSPWLLYSETSVTTHGSIVVNTSKVANDGKVYVYVLPYNSSEQAVYVFEDYAGKTSGTGFIKSVPIGANYCSQAVRMDSKGGLIWYTDSGSIYYAASESSKVFSFFIDYGDEGIWYQSTGSDPLDALINSLEMNGIDYSFDYSMDVGITSINGIANDGGKMWSLYGYVDGTWVLRDIISDQGTKTHVYVLAFSNSTIDDLSKKRWTYFDGTDAGLYTLNMRPTDVLVGKIMSSKELILKDINVSGNSVSGTIVVNKDLKIDPKLVIYTKFQNSTFIKNKMSLRMIDGVATVEFEMCGTSVPYQLLISLQGPAGDTGTTQLLQKTIDLSSLLAAS